MNRLTLPPLSHSQPSSDPWKPPDWIRTAGEIDGVEFHFDFYAVHLDDDDVQHAATPELDERFRLFRRACGASGPFDTVVMEDTPYVLFITPTCWP